MEKPYEIKNEDLKALELVRQRLHQLVNNLKHFRASIIPPNSPPGYLPPWDSIQASTKIIASAMSAIVKHMEENKELFRHTVLYPDVNYPGREEAGLLHQLLRKKHDPHVEAWIEEGREIQQKAPVVNDNDEDFWRWLERWIHDRAAQYVREENTAEYTADEVAMGIENVRTGLRPEYEDEDEEMEDGDGEIVKPKPEKPFTAPGKPVNDMLKFAMTGLGQ